MRQLLSLLAITAAASAASPAAAAAAKFDQKVDKSLAHSSNRLWPDGFLRTEFLFPPVSEESESAEQGDAVTEPLTPPQRATIRRFPSRRSTRARRAAFTKQRGEFDEVDSFLRSSTKSKPQLVDDDLSDDAFWREIEKKAMEDIAESSKKKPSPASDAFSDDAAAGEELAALSESIDGPAVQGEKVRLPLSSSSSDARLIGTTAPSMLSEESLTPTAIAAAGMVGTKFTDWSADTKDDFEAWLRSKGEAIPNDLFDTTTTVGPPQIETTTAIREPVRTAPSIAPIQVVEPWTSTQEPWSQSTTTEPEPLIRAEPDSTPQPWDSTMPPSHTSFPVRRPAATVPLAASVARPAVVAHVDAGVDPDFPLLPPRARGLHNVPEGHNVARQIDWDFARGFRIVNSKLASAPKRRRLRFARYRF